MWPDFNADPGVGNLNARAYVASIVGPKRAAFGKRVVRRVPSGSPEELVKNDAPGDREAAYVEVWLPNQILATGRRVLFSSTDAMGENADLVILGGTVVGNKVLDRYRAVLLPKEQLFAQIVSDAGGNPVSGDTPLIVAKVMF